MLQISGFASHRFEPRICLKSLYDMLQIASLAGVS